MSATLAAVMTDSVWRSRRSLTSGATVDGVITARVVRTERHPDAAKVHRVYVDAGDGRERHVWCGAFNMQAGDIVPLATPGTAMPDGRVIEPKPILGIQSDGMLCSARELGLGDDHAGIVILPGDTPLGVPYGEALRTSDRDRLRRRCHPQPARLLRLLGVARQVAARLGIPSRLRTRRSSTTAGAPTRQATVELVDGDRCARFTSTVISGVHVDRVARLDRSPSHGGRDASDQQRRRRQQLRDARAQPAQPRLRPRHAGRRRVPRALRPRRARC